MGAGIDGTEQCTVLPHRHSQEATIPKAKATQAELDAVNGMALDPIIDALLEHLPAPGDYFPKDDRKRWLQLVEMAFELIYDDQPSESTAEPNEPARLHQHGDKA
jgi:hypothetical protein